MRINGIVGWAKGVYGAPHASIYLSHESDGLKLRTGSDGDDFNLYGNFYGGLKTVITVFILLIEN